MLIIGNLVEDYSTEHFIPQQAEIEMKALIQAGRVIATDRKANKKLSYSSDL